MAAYNLPKFVDPNINSELPPGDMTFLFKNEQQKVVGDIKAHKLILAFASDVFKQTLIRKTLLILKIPPEKYLSCL